MQSEGSASADREIHKWRSTIAQKYNLHVLKGEQWLGENTQGLRAVSLKKVAEEDEWETDGEASSEARSNDSGILAEHRPVDLPSSRGRAFCESNPGAAQIELQLRIAQADEHLHFIRKNLVDRANTFRLKIRKANGNARIGASQGTKAFAEVQRLGKTVRLHAQQYRICRNACRLLGASEEIIQRFQELTDHDLRTDTKAYDASDPQSYRSSLPWFWMMNVKKKMADDAFIADCEQGYHVSEFD